MHIQPAAQSSSDIKSDILVCFCPENFPTTEKSPDRVSFFLRDLAGSKEFTGAKGQAAWIRNPDGLRCKWLLFFGIGSVSKIDSTTLMARIGHGFSTALEKKPETIAGDLRRIRRPDCDLTWLAGLAAIHAGYAFDRYKPGFKPAEKRKPVTVLLPGKRSSAPLKELNLLGEAITYAKDIANQPGNVIYPETLAREAQSLARSHRLTITVWDEKRLRKEGFGGILAVGGGSENKPRFIRLDYRGGKKSAAPLCIVGKAITFDSGGISIKPSDRMDEMKFDKCGGVAVLGVLKAAASLKLKLNITGLIASAENLPSSTAYRPGDLVKTLSGKYVEVLNTDAEGRIVLADALAYAGRLKPRAIVDMATLTGACIVALGNESAGLMGNDEKLQSQFQKAAGRCGERVWPLPLFTEFHDKVKSDIGYVKNTAGREGGTSTAATFLNAFVDDGIPWAHLDIAGTAWTNKKEPHRQKGATGFGVALVTEWLRSLR